MRLQTLIEPEVTLNFRKDRKSENCGIWIVTKSGKSWLIINTNTRLWRKKGMMFWRRWIFLESSMLMICRMSRSSVFKSAKRKRRTLRCEARWRRERKPLTRSVLKWKRVKTSCRVGRKRLSKDNR